MDIYLLGNPASGRGRGAVFLETVEAELRRRGIAPRVLRTERPGHAVSRAREAAAEGGDLFLALGGDGTIRDVVEGLGGAELPLGLIPGGTGNDLALTLEIPRSPIAALEVALSGEERTLDVWRWDQTIFVNVAGVGLDAAVAGVVNREFRRLRGTAAYLCALLKVLSRFSPVELSLEWPSGSWSGGAWLAAFGNARCYGGGMRIAPDAVPDDGLLDIVIVEAVSRGELMRQLPKVFTGAHVRHPRVRSFRVERVRVEAPPQEVTLDGELLGRTPAAVERRERGQPVRVPRRFPLSFGVSGRSPVASFKKTGP